MNIRWDAEKYRDNFSFVGHYGEALLDMIEGEDLSVLDLGCGNGNLTQKLVERGFHVTGLDGSEQQLKIAEKSCPEVHFLKADATDFHLEKPVDVVFSNAVLHWINSELQGKMLHCVYDALKAGGQFIFECGGYGCCASIHKALEYEFAERGLNYRMSFYFPTIGQYTPQMEEAGLIVKTALLFNRPTELKGDDGLRDWILMFDKTPFAKVDDNTRDSIIRAAEEHLRPVLFHDGKWYADYVRLRCKAMKDGGI